ncbi:MAG: cytochrome c-type biogenesis protein CcmH [Actinomycetota bacterium]|nr:cytochrome c-type biogenesis protein CcmH [Actinomycetota bacterium]
MNESTHPRRPPGRSAAATLLLALAIASLVIAAPVAAAPRPTLSQLETDFMCVLCHEPLNASQSPQADQERSVISSGLAKGETTAQIEKTMVAYYTPAVLAVPKATGFNAVLYILPPAVLLAGLVSLAVLLPRWRRRGRAATALAAPAEGALDTADAKRLEEELARYEG